MNQGGNNDVKPEIDDMDWVDGMDQMDKCQAVRNLQPGSMELPQKRKDIKYLCLLLQITVQGSTSDLQQ